jgi:hypothetical protein
MIPASSVAMFLVLEPVFTDLLSWATGGGSMDVWEGVGAACTSAGLALVLSAVEPAPLERADDADDDDAAYPRKGGDSAVPANDSTPLLQPPPI